MNRERLMKCLEEAEQQDNVQESSKEMIFNSPSSKFQKKAAPNITKYQPQINLLLAFSGSVATIKDFKLVKQLLKIPNLNIRCVYTQAAWYFKHCEAKRADLFNIGFDVETMEDEELLFAKFGVKVSHVKHSSRVTP